MKESLSLAQSMKVIDSAIKKGKSFIEIATEITGITAQHIAFVADEFMKKLRATTYELMKVKSLTGSTRQAIERSLSKSLVLFLFELNKNGGDCHYNDVREIVKNKYNATVNDYSTLRYFRLCEKSKTGNGYWKINERGVRFLTGELKLAEWVSIKDNKVIDASKRLVTVKDFIVFADSSVDQELIEKRKDGLSRSHE